MVPHICRLFWFTADGDWLLEGSWACKWSQSGSTRRLLAGHPAAGSDTKELNSAVSKNISERVNGRKRTGWRFPRSGLWLESELQRDPGPGSFCWAALRSWCCFQAPANSTRGPGPEPWWPRAWPQMRDVRANGAEELKAARTCKGLSRTPAGLSWVTFLCSDSAVSHNRQRLKKSQLVWKWNQNTLLTDPFFYSLGNRLSIKTPLK